MIPKIIAPILMFLSIGVSTPDVKPIVPQLMAAKEISLDNRYSNSYVSDIFKDNILLNLAYLSGKVSKAADVNWDEIKKPIKYTFFLQPGKTFAFHDDVLPEYADSVVLTTRAHFNFAEGFKSDGYLAGDGVCHLASLMYWAAKEAGLDTYAPTSHDFMPIPGIPKEYGVSIYSTPGQSASNARQNLYIRNNHKEPVIFAFSYDGESLKFTVEK